MRERCKHKPPMKGYASMQADLANLAKLAPRCVQREIFSLASVRQTKAE